jgi:hypothetical protein
LRKSSGVQVSHTIKSPSMAAPVDRGRVPEIEGRLSSSQTPRDVGIEIRIRLKPDPSGKHLLPPDVPE